MTGSAARVDRNRRPSGQWAAVSRVLAVFAFVLAAGPLRAQDAYRIGPRDVLRVIVLGQAEMSGEFPVDGDGDMTFPILGKVPAAGSTTAELEAELTRRLADGYLKRPQVSVAVEEFRSHQVFVTGEVDKPGAYALKADRSLRALLGEVGSLGPNAGHALVVIRPHTPAAAGATEAPGEPVDASAGAAEAEVFRVSLKELQSGQPQANILLEAGDTVHVPRAAQVYVSGHVARPGPYRYQEGATVLQVLTLAGGITERASSKRIKVQRIVDGERVELKVKLEDVVQPEDTLVVPERFF
jgi:polysaccharide export outer membrane protein